jgi:DnaK suppressor protein
MMSEQEVFERILYEARIRITKLKFVINKVEREEYGMCKECEEDIPYQRLLLLPESDYCTACASNLQ